MIWFNTLLTCFVPAGGSPNKINSPKASPGGKYSKATVGSPYRGMFISVSQFVPEMTTLQVKFVGPSFFCRSLTVIPCLCSTNYSVEIITYATYANSYHCYIGML